MKVTATQYEESVVCRLPQGREIEIIMVSAEGDEYSAEPNVESAPSILATLGKSGVSRFETMLVGSV